VTQLPPYAFAERSASGAARVVHLAQNELGIDPSPRAAEAVRRAADGLTRYPDPNHAALRRVIAEVHGLSPERIVCGAGSMELMGLLATAYCEAGDEVVVSQYGYKYFQVQCAIAGARVAVVPEPDLRADLEAMAAAVGARNKIVFIVEPNNPTGARLEAGGLRRLRRLLPKRVMLVVDGAYGEFVSDPAYEPGFDLVDGGDNVVVLRTFSKAYGLAGLRVGWAYAPEDVVEVLSRARAPNSVTVAGLAAAEAAVADRAHVAAVTSEVVRLREALRQTAGTLGLAALPSDGNFVLLRCPEDGPATADELFECLKRAGIIVRPMQSYGLADCLRVTIGSDEEMAILASELGRLV
jgi:histidinol-phosphate aminotransferase